jgi:tetratricopeptide (TPR) repeat protein
MRFITHAFKSLSRCALVLSVHTFALLSCTPSGGESLLTATDAYGEGQYGKAISAARRAGEGASGVKLDQAHYIEGMAEFKLGHSDEAVKLLTLASHSTDQAIAADACVGLGTLEIRRERFAAAADAYRRAAAMLNGADRERALLIASRADARAKPFVVVNVPAPITIEPPTSKPNVVAAPSLSLSKNYAIQAGAFSDTARATIAANLLRERARGSDLGETRIIEKSRSSGGAPIFVVQIGAFANRSIAGKAMKPFAKLAYTVEPYAE